MLSPPQVPPSFLAREYIVTLTSELSRVPGDFRSDGQNSSDSDGHLHAEESTPPIRFFLRIRRSQSRVPDVKESL